MPKSISKLIQNNATAKTNGRPVVQSRAKSKPSSQSSLDGREVVRLEYEQLNQWARHGEEAAHRIFNFYVTLLTAALGGFILITQLINGSLQTVLLIGSAVCGLLMIIGVTFLDALIGQYSRNIHYRIGIEMIRNCFRQNPAIADIMSKPQIATLETDSETVWYTLMEGRLSTTQVRKAPKLIQLFTFLTPVSSQLIFLSMVTSLLVGALVWLLVWGLTELGVGLDKMILTSTLVVVLSFLTQNIMVRIGLQRPLDDLREVLGSRTEHREYGQK